VSNELTRDLAGQFKWTANFFDRFIASCPQNIWAQPSGRFPVWQIVWHSLYCAPFFLGPETGEPPACPYSLEVLLFKDLGQRPADKAATAAYAGAINAFAESFFASCKDTDLSGPHAGFSARFKAPKTNIQAITTLISHHMYHFGMCDAALRAGGLEGLF
jgi:hypothetical protein